MKKPFVASAAVLLLASCATSSRDPALERYRPCPSLSGCITLNVSAPDASRAAGRPVLLVTSGGVRSIGATDEDGIFLAPKELVGRDALALLLCWDARSLACTAVRLDNGDAAVYDWLNVTLPANPLMHRSQARSATPESMVPLPAPTPTPAPVP